MTMRRTTRVPPLLPLLATLSLGALPAVALAAPPDGRGWLGE